ARFTCAFDRRCANYRLDIERVRPDFETSRRIFRSCGDSSEGINFMAIFKRQPFGGEGGKKREIPHGVFQKCPGCGEVVTEIQLAENQRVCPHCDHHFAQSAKERLDNLLDPQTFVEMDADLKSIDTLRFQGMASYKDRLKKYQQTTGLIDAVISGHGIIDGYKVAIAV